MTPGWNAIANDALSDEATLIRQLISVTDLDAASRQRIVRNGVDLVRRIRAGMRPGLMEVFLAEYGLSTDEGLALMCLAESLLRVPDRQTIDALIEDKIAPSNWGEHLGKSSSALVNVSTLGLMLGSKLMEEHSGMAGHIQSAIRRAGEPVIRRAAIAAMEEMGRQFVLGQDIRSGMARAAAREKRGFTYSYDMLGEAARTEADARRYHQAYAAAIHAIAAQAMVDDITAGPAISVKLSALHPRYELSQRERVLAELVPRLRSLAVLARKANIGLTVDAEESDRLALSLMVIESVLAEPVLAGWDGFGVAVQAYGRRCGAVIDWLHDLAQELDRRIMVRLVKGAYWDSEIKRAQVMGLPSFPVFTRKAATDVSYIANARKLLGLTDRLYPQFATHNAHSVTSVLDLAASMKIPPDSYEFQRLHGMGERLHDLVMAEQGTRCRIYAPIGPYRDLLAYLVRRLLENGANSSFVNQLVDEDIPPEHVVTCPLACLEQNADLRAVRPGPDIFPDRKNSRGFDPADLGDLARIDAGRAPFHDAVFTAGPILADGQSGGVTAPIEMTDPATGALVGRVWQASAADVDRALSQARMWEADAKARAAVLIRAASLYEAHFGEIFAIVAREGGKTLPDAISELREAVDYLYYYASQAESLTQPPCGTFVCISPWNFPLAIFTGQIAAALMAGNAVIAKPAEQTPVIASIGICLLHEAGVPRDALQFLPGAGDVGAMLTQDARVDGVAFTGSLETAQIIRRAMAESLAPGAPLIAETGGLNAMILDSTALPEQAVRDIMASSFQSAGQRCSALRCLYVQEDVADDVQKMLFGALRELQAGDPWDAATDFGPVIDSEAQAGLRAYIDKARADGRLLIEGEVPAAGTFVPPCIIRLAGIEELKREVFGPVLHLARFRADDLDRVVDAINASGYGLTFGLHSRIDRRVQHVSGRIHAGNIYVNRNQIGAVVGSQPFGGEGLSGTGPKAGGPHYLRRFTDLSAPRKQVDHEAGAPVSESAIRCKLGLTPPVIQPQIVDMPGPTGESNRLHLYPRPPFLCLGPGEAAARMQANAIRALKGQATEAAGLAPEALEWLDGFSGALWWGDERTGQACARALSRRKGPILPLITGAPDIGHVMFERHVCIDTTASGGNAGLLVEMTRRQASDIRSQG